MGAPGIYPTLHLIFRGNEGWSEVEAHTDRASFYLSAKVAGRDGDARLVLSGDRPAVERAVEDLVRALTPEGGQS